MLLLGLVILIVKVKENVYRLSKKNVYRLSKENVYRLSKENVYRLSSLGLKYHFYNYK